jgi:tetratricopeptide (TPR) repeat protein
MKKSILLLGFSLLFLAAQSQRLNTPTLSPFSKISQEIGLTEISLEYSRPSAKGRTVFGALVPFGKMWRTGANASTKITITESAIIGGNKIDAGTYAIYTIPGKEKWTIIIHSNTKMRSIAGDAYKQENDVCRFEVQPKMTNDYIETFTIQFTDIRSDACHLQLSWENTHIQIPIEVEVDQKIEDQMAAFLKDPANIPHRTYFQAAQYYLHNDKDLVSALAWINAALEKSPENFRYGLLKAKIYDKSGNHKEAMASINKANTWAKNAQNANYIEQTDIFRQSLMKKE